MKILITRPRQDSESFAPSIIALGHLPVIAPLLEINYIKEVDSDLPCIITSRHALNAIKNKQTKLFVLGEQTTNLAISMGFSEVYYMGQNVNDLKKNLPLKGELLYLSGADVTDDLGEFSKVKREIVYSANLITVPSATLLEFIALNETKAILFFSLRTAEAFINIINKSRLSINFNDIIALTLSDKISKYLENYGLSKCYSAKEPSSSELLALVGKLK